MENVFCDVVRTMGDSKVMLILRQWVEQQLRPPTTSASTDPSDILMNIRRATVATQARRVGVIKDAGGGKCDYYNIFEPSWRLKTFFETPGSHYNSTTDYSGTVLVACRENPRHAVYESFGVTPVESSSKVHELRSVGTVDSRMVEHDGMRPAMSIVERAKWSFIKQNVDNREGLWKTGNSARLLSGVSEPIQLNSHDAIDSAYEDIFQQWMYKQGTIERTTPEDDSCIVAISYKHVPPDRMTRIDFGAIINELRIHFNVVRLWLDACLVSGSDLVKWVHIGLTPYVCMPVVILRNEAYEKGYDRVWITLERRLALKGCPVICVGVKNTFEQLKGVSEFDNLKSICSDLLAGNISRNGLTVDSDYDDLVRWSKSILMLPGGAVANEDSASTALDEYYSSNFAQRVLMSNELSKNTGGAEREWITGSAGRTGR